MKKYVPIRDVENYTKDPSFERVGKQFFDAFVTLADLKPTSNFLDVGCGAGRMAIPLCKYLKDGSYEGFDIHKEGIEWCKKNIESNFPNFHFLVADIFNKFYNETGKTFAKDFKFPYEDGCFDFVNLTSVFTHLLPYDVENYFSQISRVLKNNGKCFATFFLLNQESLKNMEKGKASFDFKFQFDGFRSINNEEPERAIAYDEEFIAKLYVKNSLKISKPVYYGSWSGGEKLSFFPRCDNCN